MYLQKITHNIEVNIQIIIRTIIPELSTARTHKVQVDTLYTHACFRFKVWIKPIQFKGQRNREQI